MLSRHPLARDIGLAILMGIALVGGLLALVLLTDGGSRKAQPTVTVTAPSRHFQSAPRLLGPPIPGPLTKSGAELRVLSTRAIAAVPAALRPAITGPGAGGLIRQNTHASCYLNVSGTARHCTMVIRRGVKPWAEVEFRVDASGTHYLSASYWA